jgi:hypothetical protein
MFLVLRGPVKTVEGKTKINDLAKSVAGQVPMDDQLEVKAAK